MVACKNIDSLFRVFHCYSTECQRHLQFKQCMRIYFKLLPAVFLVTASLKYLKRHCSMRSMSRITKANLIQDQLEGDCYKTVKLQTLNVGLELNPASSLENHS